MKRGFAAFLFFCLLSSPLEAGSLSSIQWITETIPLKVAPSAISLQAKWMRPKTRMPGEKFPLLLVFGGFEEAGKVLELLEPKKRLIFASFDYPYAGSRKFQFPHTLFEVRALRRAVRETQTGIPLLLNELLRRPEVDPARIGIIGASFGSPFALHAAAADPRFNALILIHGFAGLADTLTHRLIQLWQEKLGLATAPLAWMTSRLILFTLDPPLPEEEAIQLKAHQKVLLIEALSDHFIPARSRLLLWESLLKSEARVERFQMPGKHLLPGATAQIRQISSQAERWMKESGFVH